MDTLITIIIVAAAVAWAGLRAWRRATAKAASCAGSCAGCAGGRGLRPPASSLSGGLGRGHPAGRSRHGLPLPSRSERKVEAMPPSPAFTRDSGAAFSPSSWRRQPSRSRPARPLRRRRPTLWPLTPLSSKA
ncbi:MAG: FeoB-associated Cys-rich membrane protein [Holophagales bacterium]|nr:FeoB-associated Cys-rich membrane protein [Holophagales bacterium]